MVSLRYAPVFALLTCCSIYDESMLGDAVSDEGAAASSAAGSAHLNLAGSSHGGTNAAGGKGQGAGAAALAEAGEAPGAAGGTATVGDAGGPAVGGSEPVGGGGKGTAGAAGTGGVLLPPGVDLVDDMEDGNAYLAPSPPRFGFWYLAGDATVGAKLPKIEELVRTLAPARGSSSLAIHFSATGFKDWGASVGLAFTDASSKRGAYDADDALGISFWVRGSVSQGGKLRVLFPTLGSDPTGKKCGGADQGQCLDHYATQVSVTADWQQVSVSFASLHQAGWGVPLSGFAPAEMLGIEWTAGALDLDVWLDDVALIRPE